ncbi:MAG TPA: aminopeptidase P family protein [Stellaceae bacterium]|nr:aminopeptidase P family protein [Stellaceae bacterium]
MSECREIYQGDESLTRMLGVAGSSYDLAGLRSLIHAVLAAPEPRDAAAWTRLVARDPSPALVAQLQALKRLLATSATGASKQTNGAPDHAKRLADLRGALGSQGIDGFIVPRTDAFQNEYVPACNERLAWLTGFTGSAGLAVVLKDRAAIFVDGRYTLQAAVQVDTGNFEICHLIEKPPEGWMTRHLGQGARLGYDAWLLTPDQLARYQAAARKAGASLVPVEANPLDTVWTGRPPQPVAPVEVFPVSRAGKPSADKRREIAAKLIEEGCEAAVLTAPESLAWLLNIRGADVPHTPLPLGFAILHADAKVELFIDPRKLLPDVTPHLGSEVTVAPLESFGAALDALKDKAVLADAASAAAWVFLRLETAGARVIRGSDPTRLPKACKNPVELDGIRAAHRRDGAAMVRFLAWLEARLADGDTLGEIAVADKLEAFRAEAPEFRDLSFDTISGAGPNGAIVHYRVTPETDRVLEPGSFYLLDSGAQYVDGTTDITRTLAVGTPGDEMMDRYTRVLQGHIALASAIFVKGTSGAALDVLARQPLWQAGLNYDHGTGHGVGHYLSVHEGPQRVHFQSKDGQALLPGMVISNEPGYYKAGAYGIRIENLVAVREAVLPGAEREMLDFEVLTLCPIDTTPIDVTLLSPHEIAWIDAYHTRVRAEIGPLIEDEAVLAWLERATQPLLAEPD